MTTEVPFDLVQPGEVFKAHPQWGAYLVSDHGRVWSTKSDRFVGFTSGANLRSGGAGRTRRIRNVPKKPYRQVTVAGGPPKVSPMLHVLVLETFVGPRPGPDYEGDHVNHDSLDNRLENLQWITAAENQARKLR